MDSSQVHRAADFARGLLAEVLDDLASKIDGPSQTDQIRESLKRIQENYQRRLGQPSTKFRTDWGDPANRCAYLFLYLLQHSHLVCSSLQDNLELFLTCWRGKRNLKVCCIGGGPGSDLVGLTTFLHENNLFPSRLECLVLDRYPSWKDTWMSISGHIPCPDRVHVAYKGCDVVRDRSVPNEISQFIQQADMLTFVKSFSAVSAFFRRQPAHGDLILSFLRVIKPGCLVLYIDNKHVNDDQFELEFASRAGLELVSKCLGTRTVPRGQYSSTIRKYCRLLDQHPMRSCEVTIQLFRKTVPVEAVRGNTSMRPSSSISTSAGHPQTPHPPRHRAVQNTAPNRSHRQYHPQDDTYNYWDRESPRDNPRNNRGWSSIESGIILGIGAFLLISWWRNR